MLLFCFLGSAAAQPPRRQQVSQGNFVMVGRLPEGYTPRYPWEIPPELHDLKVFLQNPASMDDAASTVWNLNSAEMRDWPERSEGEPRLWLVVVHSTCPARHREEVPAA